MKGRGEEGRQGDREGDVLGLNEELLLDAVSHGSANFGLKDDGGENWRPDIVSVLGPGPERLPVRKSLWRRAGGGSEPGRWPVPPLAGHGATHDSPRLPQIQTVPSPPPQF